MKQHADGEFITPRLRKIIVAMLLTLHFILGVGSMCGKSFTFDEPVFIAGGMSAWLENKFNTNPEGGILTQRYGTLPLVIDKSINLPNTNNSGPCEIDQWRRAINMVVYSPGAVIGLFKARLMILLVSVLCGYLVWRISTVIFGSNGGLFSLALYSFSPTILANAGLMTADMMAATAFLAATWCGCKLVRKITLKHFILSSLTVLWVVTAKMSGILIGPLLLIMGIIRITRGRPLAVDLPWWKYQADTRIKQLKVLAVTGTAMGIIIWIGIWGMYSFQYRMVPGNNVQSFTWPDPGLNVSRKIVGKINDWKLLPQAYLYGLDFTLKYSKSRPAFLLGEKYTKGKWYFFPFTFLVKTPVPILLLLFLLTLSAGVRFYLSKTRWQSFGRMFWKATPLIVFFIFYWLICISSGLNIGHRHLLPLYPIIFILCGAALSKLPARYEFQKKHLLEYVCFAISLWMAVEAFLAYPNYLAFFNHAAGNRDKTYRLLCDSSLDWGQELFNMHDYLDKVNPPGPCSKPVYVSVFSILPPKYYLPEHQVVTQPKYPS